VTNDHQSYGFVEFRSEEDADYAIKVRQQALSDFPSSIPLRLATCCMRFVQLTAQLALFPAGLAPFYLSRLLTAGVPVALSLVFLRQLPAVEPLTLRLGHQQAPCAAACCLSNRS
jgi:hypothetical protein